MQGCSEITAGYPVEDESWLDSELGRCDMPDARLAKRLRQIFKQLGGAIGEALPRACQDWASTKAAYRFLSNERVSEYGVLRGHFEATRLRVAAASGPVLLLQDTTEFIYKRRHPERIGFTKTVNGGKDRCGRWREHTLCGLLMHSSLAVTTAGVPLGLTGVKFWTRKKFKQTAALKRKVNPTRVPIEITESYRWLETLRQSHELLSDPGRCIHVGDRESDIYELFCLAAKLETHFIVRAQTDRLAGPYDRNNRGPDRMTVFAQLAKVPAAGQHTVEVRDAQGKPETVKLTLSFATFEVHPPIGKAQRYPHQKLTYIHAIEETEPEGRPRIDWKLVTNLTVETLDDATEKLSWYALRWKIEVFHKIMKSGCRAEDAKLRTAERLVKLLAVFAVLSWRVFWITMSARAEPDAPANTALTETEIKVLDELLKPSSHAPPDCQHLAGYVNKIARLGGYLDRNSDPPPGNLVMWRGMARLTDIVLGVELARRIVGN